MSYCSLEKTPQTQNKKSPKQQPSPAKRGQPVVWFISSLSCCISVFFIILKPLVHFYKSKLSPSAHSKMKLATKVLSFEQTWWWRTHSLVAFLLPHPACTSSRFACPFLGALWKGSSKSSFVAWKETAWCGVWQLLSLVKHLVTAAAGWLLLMTWHVQKTFWVLPSKQGSVLPAGCVCFISIYFRWVCAGFVLLNCVYSWMKFLFCTQRNNYFLQQFRKNHLGQT